MAHSDQKIAADITALRSRLAITPDDTHTISQLAFLLLGSDNQRLSAAAEAEDLLQRVTTLASADDQTEYHLGIAIERQGKSGALAHYERAIQLNPGFGHAYFALAKALFLIDRIDEAERNLAIARRLLPDNAAIQNEYADLSTIVIASRQKKLKATVARWPVMRSDFLDISMAIKKYILPAMNDMPRFLTKASRVVTLGSCFAGNLARALRAYGIDATNITIGEYVNSTFANKAFLDWVTQRDIGANLTQRMESIFESNRDFYEHEIRQADLVVFTLGVAPAFFSRSDGTFVMPRPSQISMGALRTEFDFRTTSVEENRENLSAIVRTLRDLNPSCKIVLTLSPVPLSVTFEQSSVILADCLSKSTLRVALEEVLKEKTHHVFYWPSFEIVRWLGTYTGEAYGLDDGTSHHVSEKYIEKIIESFIQLVGTDDLIPATTDEYPNNP